MEGTLRTIARRTNTEFDRVEERVESLLGELTLKEKELEHFKQDIVARRVDSAIAEAMDKEGVKIVTLFMENASAEDLRKATDVVRSKVKDCIVVVGTTGADDKGLVVASVSRDLQKRYSAGKIVKNLTGHYGGKGGGGANIAQGGIPAAKIPESLKNVEQFIDS
jgi:alanyl-tRNA synthetase